MKARKVKLLKSMWGLYPWTRWAPAAGAVTMVRSTPGVASRARTTVATSSAEVNTFT
jgi:hypothetical protein